MSVVRFVALCSSDAADRMEELGTFLAIELGNKHLQPHRLRRFPIWRANGQSHRRGGWLIYSDLTWLARTKADCFYASILSRSAYHRRSRHQSASRVRAGLCPVHDLSPASYRQDPQTAQNSSQGRSRPRVVHEQFLRRF